jgi:hypothetical protein
MPSKRKPFLSPTYLLKSGIYKAFKRRIQEGEKGKALSLIG